MKTIGIYPGTFQPADKSHYDVYKKLKAITRADTFVATTDREPSPEAPLNFGDKEQIWVRHGVPASHIVKVTTLPTDHNDDWRPKEIYSKFSSTETVAVVALNQIEASRFSKKKQQAKPPVAATDEFTQELQELYGELQESKPSEIWLDRKGNASYFQPYKGNENSLKPFEEHAYVVIMDDTKIGGKP